MRDPCQRLLHLASICHERGAILTEEIYHVENVFQLDIVRDTKNQEVPQNVITSKNDQAPSNDLDHDILAANNIVAADMDDGAQGDEADEGEDKDGGGSWLPRDRPLGVEQLVRRAHRGLGHVANDRLARILQQAGARKEAVDYRRGRGGGSHCRWTGKLVTWADLPWRTDHP